MDRQVFLLDKGWRFSIAAEEKKAVNSHSNSYAISKAGGAIGPASATFDDEGWRMLDLPHDYYAESDFHPDNLLSHGYRTRNNSWYRKLFRLDKSFENKRIFINFEGISVFSTIYLNGSIVARSFSAYNETGIDVTDRAFFGDRPNVLAVCIDGFATEGWWYEGAGIYRHVRLFAKERQCIAHDGLWICPRKKDGYWEVVCEVKCDNIDYSDKPVYALVELRDPAGDITGTGRTENIVIPADGSTAAKTVVSVTAPQLWDVDSPVLYSAEVTLFDESGEKLDSDSVKFGFREILFDADKGFFLNGRSLKLKGVCCHQDHAGVGVAVPDSIQDYRIKLLKEMGVNAYRCSHNLPAREILDACDKYGILVMDENRRFEARPEVLDAVEQMIRRDRNHPSVIMYSLFNEEPLQNTATGQKIYLRMLSRAKALDDTRYYTGAINGGLSENGAAVKMDVVGVNYGLRHIEPFHKAHPALPLTGSENNSAVTTRGCYKTDNDAHVLSGYDEEAVPWGQTVRETWRFVLDHDYLAGIFIWTGFDYRGEPTPYTWPSVSSQFGIMDTCGFPKDSYYFNKACFTDEPMMYILPHWNHKAGDTVRVMTVTNCDEVELFLDGRSLGRRSSTVRDQLEWQVDYMPGKLSAVGYRNGRRAAEYSVSTSSAPSALRIGLSKNSLVADGQDTVAVNVAALDENGQVLPDASELVRFSVEGDGCVIGVGNGDPNSHEPDNASERKLFHGLCQALVQAGRTPGRITVTASAEGYESASVQLEAVRNDNKRYIEYSVDRRISGWKMSPGNITEDFDPLTVYSDNDMNSLTSTDLAAYPDGFTEGSRLYMAAAVMPERADGVLYIEKACGIITVYIDGKCIYEGKKYSETLYVPVPLQPGEKCELRIAVRAFEKRNCGVRGKISLS